MINEISKYLPDSWIALLIIIVIGALGSATWDILLKPSYSKIRNFLLSLITLWKKKQKDYIYSEISYGSIKQHLSSYNSEILTIIFLSLLASCIIFVKVGMLDKSLENYNQVISLIDEVKKDPSIEAKTKIEDEEKVLITKLDKLKEKSESINNILFWFFLVVLIFGLYMIGDKSAQFIVKLYIHSSSCYLDRLFRIIRPHISTKQYNELQSQQALINSKESFEDLTSKLYKIADENEIKYKKYNPW